jgi:hypothetical protein
MYFKIYIHYPLKFDYVMASVLQKDATSGLYPNCFPMESNRYCIHHTRRRLFFFVLRSKIILAFTLSFCYITIRCLNKKHKKEVPCQETATHQRLPIHVKTVDRRLQQLSLDKIARNTKFYRRTPQKIQALPFIAALCAAAHQNIFSYGKIAFLLGLRGILVSKQAVAERFNLYAVALFKQALSALIGKVSGTETIQKQGAPAFFKNVYLQDSTYLSLPQPLADAYPGAKNHTNKKNAGMKIQAVFNLKKDQMADFSLSAFNRTDQAASKDILNLVQPKDLVIRDLGYFVLDVFKDIAQKGAFFLSRLRSNVAVYCPNTGKRLNLLSILKKQPCTDIDVLIGRNQKLPVRLVAIPVPEHIANERRRKAKNNRDRRCNPSKESLQLLGWEIFIANVKRDIWNPSTLCKVYAIRWRIEIVFKAWKSHMSLASIPEGSKNELDVFIYSQLVNITIFHAFFDHLNRYMIDKHNRFISMLKLAPLFSHVLNAIHTLHYAATDDEIEEYLSGLLLKHCCYEKRNKRTNYPEQLALLASLA